ncbi:EF hand family protein [Tritrichomonas foetus]|uniref:EF hand family protein n=1 Tax=Tritrichomonas foetus TaxID=1144522 RepID=A0A1J4K4K3_9EUKA|nr:EF hand family protein [Tritrichomonas foetus]|eukprot:OHT06123.1 EF hand family protein [Tritrichomonas foetus]
MSSKTIIANVKKTVQDNGPPDVATLSKMFNEADTNHHSYLDYEDEIEYVLKRMGLKLKPRELKVIKKELDPDGEEKIYLANFIAFFAKELPENRNKVIKESFKALSPNGESKVTLEQLRQRFGNSEYTIIGGRRVILNQFINDLARFFDMDNDGTITEADFINYYRDFSDKIESDELFTSIVKALWAF